MENNDLALWQISRQPWFDPVRRAIARSYRLKAYTDYCDTHGATDHATATGECVACQQALTAHGRPPVTSARSDARRAGRSWFPAQCAIHGAVAHGVAHGRCLTCYTTAGVKRSTRPTSSDRALARRDGQPRYVAECVTHGPTDHSTARGQCLQCFTTLGKPRLDAKVTACQEGTLPRALTDLAHALEQERGPHWAARRALLLTAAGALETTR